MLAAKRNSLDFSVSSYLEEMAFSQAPDSFPCTDLSRYASFTVGMNSRNECFIFSAVDLRTQFVLHFLDVINLKLTILLQRRMFARQVVHCFVNIATYPRVRDS